ncbi:MAG: hypothetical protein H7Y37_02780 [Anaerolineae bacterium]|nr:hypothetical protein [Gloeobacterales cyanobacterium ES-bin-313]
MHTSDERFSLGDHLNVVCDIWFNRQSSQPSEVAAAYTVLIETLNAYDVSAPVITNLLTPRLGLTRGGKITDTQELGRLAMQRLGATQDGNALGHYEVDNALRCALMVVQNGTLISDAHEQQAVNAIQSSIEHLKVPVKRF